MRLDLFTEVRSYLTVLLKRWPFALIPAIVVAALGIITFSLPQPTYSTSVQHVVSQSPTDSANSNEESRQFVWINSQYVVNTITDWANGTAFAARVASEVNARGLTTESGEELIVTTETVANALLAGTIRSKLEVYVDHPDEQTVQIISEAATLVLNRDNLEAIPQLGDAPAFVTPIDEIDIDVAAPGLSAYLDLPIRLIVAVGLGIAAALFAEYIDPRVRTRQQIQAIELPIIGEIPAE